MTIYTTDFSEYTVGNPLSDWTDYWSSGAFTYLAQANSGDFKVGTKECNYLVSGDARTALTWDDIGDVADSDIIVKINANTISSSHGIRICSRVSGSSASENAYFIDISLGLFKLAKHVAGSGSASLSSLFFEANPNTNYWVRFRTVGTTLQAKIWSEDSIEPSEWKVSITDTSLSSGACGFGGFYAATDYEIDYFSCGTGTDSAVFPPSGWDLSDKFGYVGGFTGTSAALNTSFAHGGEIVEADKELIGIRLNCVAHGGQIRVGVYSGGDLSTGLNNATLLHDFGQTTGSDAGYIELACSGIAIPENEVLWIIVKGDASGFTTKYSSKLINSGNYQKAHGRCNVESIIGKDPAVAFPATFADTNGTFDSYWFDFNILLSDVVPVATPIITPTSGEYPATQLISMSCATSGASIYYTEDGGTPDVTDTLYSAPFELSSAKTIKAIGIKSGLTDSNIASEIYTIAEVTVQQPMIFIIT